MLNLQKNSMGERIKPFSPKEKYINIVNAVLMVIFCILYLCTQKYYIDQWTRISSSGEFRLVYCLFILFFGMYIINNTMSFYQYNLLFMKSLGISNNHVCLAAFRKTANYYWIWQVLFLILNVGLSPKDLLGVFFIFLSGSILVFLECVFELMFQKLKILSRMVVGSFLLLLFGGVLGGLGTILFLVIADVLLFGILRQKGNLVMIELKEPISSRVRILQIGTKSGKQTYSKHKILRHVKREIAVIFRSKSILITKIIADVMLVMLMFVSESVLLSEGAFIFVQYLNMAFLEHLYIQDNQNRMLYVQLGESSKAFFGKKIVTTLFYTSDVYVLFIIQALLMRLQWYYFFLGGLVWVVLVLYYSLYYFAMYTFLRDRYNTAHNILFLMTTVFLFVSPLMIFTGIAFYVFGKKSWEREKYVEDK